MAQHGFPKRLRLLRASDFERVFAARSSAGSPWLVAYGAANGLGHPRLGLVVSRRVAGAAARNRWKRLLREAFRHTQRDLPPIDLVCIVRSPAPPPLTKLMETLTALGRRLARQEQPTMAHQEKKLP